jgi:hypothetical protein
MRNVASKYQAPAALFSLEMSTEQLVQRLLCMEAAVDSQRVRSGYIDEFGDKSWELDALEPTVINALIKDEVFGVRDVDKWAEAVDDFTRLLDKDPGHPAARAVKFGQPRR